jgi:hypothetical protein
MNMMHGFIIKSVVVHGLFGNVPSICVPLVCQRTDARRASP